MGVLTLRQPADLRRIFGFKEQEYQMNARMRRIERAYLGPVVIAGNGAGGRLRSGRWTRFLRALERTRLLLRSPIASLRWARAKRRTAASQRQAQTSNWQGRRSNSFAECEKDGIVMGF